VKVISLAVGSGLPAARHRDGEAAARGDLGAIRLYRETMAQAGSGNEVTIVDDI